MKKILSILIILSLLVPIISLANEDFEFKGSIITTTYTDNAVYYQSELTFDEYPKTHVYEYNPLTMQQPQLLSDKYKSEEDYVVVIDGKAYSWTNKNTFASKDSKDVIKLNDTDFLKKLSDLYISINSLQQGSTLTWIMQSMESDNSYLCTVDLQDKNVKHLNITKEFNVVGILPYKDNKNLLAVSGENNLTKILEFDTTTLETKELLSINNIESIAYDKISDSLVFIKDKALYRYYFDGKEEKLLDDMPERASLTAYIIDGKYVFLKNVDKDGYLKTYVSTIDLP